MSTLYLVDLFVQPIYNTVILDVHSGPDVLLNGTTAIRVPDYIQVQNPVNAADLVTKKHLGMLAFFAGYSFIHFDDLFNTGDVNLAAPDTHGIFGERQNITLFPGQGLSPSIFTSNVIGLASVPTQAVVTWETWELLGEDVATDRTKATYHEVPSSTANILCQVSFDNGGHFYPVLDGGIVNIPLIGQGNQFIIQLRNVTDLSLMSRSLRLGSWAVIY